MVPGPQGSQLIYFISSFLNCRNSHYLQSLPYKDAELSFIVKQKKLQIPSMAALRNFTKRRSNFSLCKEKLFSTTGASPLVDSPSLVQRLRDLPKDLPGTKIKKEVSQVIKHTLIHMGVCL